MVVSEKVSISLSFTVLIYEQLLIFVCVCVCMCVWGGLWVWVCGVCVCGGVRLPCLYFRGPSYDNTTTHRGLYTFRGPKNGSSENIG